MARTPPKIGVNKGWLRITVRDGERWYYISLGLADTNTNRKLAESVKDLVEKDLQAGCFDESLVKYRFDKSLGKLATDLTPSEMYFQWLESEKSRDVSSTTAKWYERVGKDLARLFPKLKAKDLSGNHCKQYIRYLEKNNNQPYGIKRKLQACNQAWIWLIDNHYLTFNPWTAFIRKIKPKPQEMVKPFSECEITAILEAFGNNRTYWAYKPFVEFLFFTGTRVGEAIGLLWKDVSEDFSQITIRRQYTRKQYKATKTGKVRTFQVSERVKNILLSLKPYESNSEKPVFTYNGHIIDITNFRSRAWKQCIEQANIPYRTVYNTRATFVSLALANGLTPIYIAQITGHSPSTMFQHYAGFIEGTPVLPF